MCRSMVDIQSPTAEIRRGKKEDRRKERRKKLQDENIMVALLHRATIMNEKRIIEKSIDRPYVFLKFRENPFIICQLSR